MQALIRQALEISIATGERVEAYVNNAAHLTHALSCTAQGGRLTARNMAKLAAALDAGHEYDTVESLNKLLYCYRQETRVASIPATRPAATREQLERSARAKQIAGQLTADERNYGV